MGFHEARLEYYVAIIEKNIDPDDLLQDNNLEEYYRATGWAYRFFHSREGAIHMAINPSGVFDPKGYRVQAGRVSEYLDPGMCVLELGAGSGFNSDLLAKENPGVSFMASDKTPAQLARMREVFKGQDNVSLARIDYQDISCKQETFDLLFLVETLCHSQQFVSALLEMKRVLKPGGRIIIFDAWATSRADADCYKRASTLAMKSMAVDKGWYLDDFRALAKDQFRVIKEEDFTREIDPCLQRLHDLAWRFLRRPRLVTLARKTMPLVAQNAIAGLLMPSLFACGAWKYKMFVLEKKK